jgi:hypothetical protein
VGSELREVARNQSPEKIGHVFWTIHPVQRDYGAVPASHLAGVLMLLALMPAAFVGDMLVMGWLTTVVDVTRVSRTDGLLRRSTFINHVPRRTLQRL